MKRNRQFFNLMTALFMAGGLSSVLAQGNLIPLGAPAPTMKSLDQIEARQPISSAPFTISQSGSYYLTTNLTVSSGNAINIAANGVKLDLNGFTIRSVAPTASGTAIQLGGSLHDVVIANGFIVGGVTNDSAGNYGGPGFNNGIVYTGNNPTNVTVSRICVSGCLLDGIFLGAAGATADSCQVQTVGSYGIAATIVKTCLAINCGSTAINGSLVSDCRGTSFSGYGIFCNQVRDSYGSSSSYTGIYAQLARDCIGYAGTTGTGIDASTMAVNCSGFGSSGYGIQTGIAQSCDGQSDSGYGLDSTRVAFGSRGYSFSGTGLTANIANSCFGSTIAGTAQVITHKYNMP